MKCGKLRWLDSCFLWGRASASASASATVTIFYHMDMTDLSWRASWTSHWSPNPPPAPSRTTYSLIYYQQCYLYILSLLTFGRLWSLVFFFFFTLQCLSSSFNLKTVSLCFSSITPLFLSVFLLKERTLCHQHI